MPSIGRRTTTTLLLNGLHDPADSDAWHEFDHRYRPVLVGLGMRLGLQPADAADAAQETLVQFIRDYRAGQYDRTRGRLGAWLVGICRHRVIDQQRAGARRGERRGDSVVAGIPDAATLTRMWDEELRRRILDEALQTLREDTETAERTIEVFERVAVREVPPATVAEEFEMSVAEVYRIKHRVTKRLRAIVDQLTAAYTTEG